MKEENIKSSQRFINALNFIKEHQGYLKWSKEKLKNLLQLNDDEFNLLLDEIKSLKREYYRKNYTTEKSIDEHLLQGYWLKTKRVSAYFKVNQTLSPDDIITYIKNELINLPKLKIKNVSNKKDSSKLGILNVYDIHIDKLSYKKTESVDLNYINEYVDYLITSIIKIVDEGNKNYQVNTIIFPIGNDLFNTNGFTQTTKKGTPQKVAINHELAFKIGLRFCITIINYLLESGYKVYIPIIYGNHDEDVDFYLGVTLESLYNEVNNIFINNSLSKRKYYLFGKNYFAFGHGDLEKKKISELPLIMAVENPDYWSKSITRTFYLGDIHHKQEYKFLRTKDYPGCTIQFLRSTSFVDQWHNDNMFIGVPRTIEYHLYDDTGMICNLINNISSHGN